MFWLKINLYAHFFGYLLCLFTLNLNNCHLKAVELLHGFCLDIVTHIDVWLHGLII